MPPAKRRPKARSKVSPRGGRFLVWPTRLGIRVSIGRLLNEELLTDMDGRARGIDVSHNDNDGNPIMWSSVGPFGIDFVIMKASEGAGFTDPQFHNNWPGVKAAGLVRGAYHMIGFVDPTTNSAWRDVVHRQVDRFPGIVGPPQSGDLPPALDIEDLNSPAGWKNLIQKDRSSALAVVREYITYTTSQLNGINPILYTGSFWWSELADPDPGTMPSPSIRSGLPSILWQCRVRLQVRHRRSCTIFSSTPPCSTESSQPTFPKSGEVPLARDGSSGSSPSRARCRTS